VLLRIAGSLPPGPDCGEGREGKGIWALPGWCRGGLGRDGPNEMGDGFHRPRTGRLILRFDLVGARVKTKKCFLKEKRDEYYVI
jgi:hypothetical protein